ncbi:MAG TPA: bifunctional phosphopantothenoylcysteine decarboxylase/phosphopantothenate--cysteine ligase CoaBC, partial [Salinimicrobium sp.]|nr:bifunctional phosphopantothenoylcysteine decarboxylase/phosphopantothenate--cysteine ligase CoaBC [Salinimicrobium sp.]
AEPEDILNFIENHIQKSLRLRNKKILITAGPTYEAIDPVRFIGNHSSGKMGYEMAKAAAEEGAEVVLVSGPTHLENPHPSVNIIRVQTAREMQEAVMEHFEKMDAVIAAAAVSDYRPIKIADQKIKKTEEIFTLELEKNPDILATLGKLKKDQVLIGFALETENEEQNAVDKLQRKNLDFIVLNSLNDKGAGFKKETNKISILFKEGEKKDFDLKSKTLVARDIIDELKLLLHE